MSARTVTIAIPTRNRSALLLRAVKSALRQTHPHVEVLVSDNASDDDTQAVLAEIRDPRLRVIRQPSLVPMMPHWDRCLAEARGELFMLLSDDDFLEPTAVQRLEAALGERVGVAYCAATVVDGRGEAIGTGRQAPAREAPRDTIVEFFAVRRTPFACSVLMRTGDVRDAGGYTGVPLALIADARVWMAVSLRYDSIAFVDERLSSYCIHQGNATSAARVQEWLDDNARLAQWCADALASRGDAAAAKEVLSRLGRINFGTAVSALVNRGTASTGRVGALRDLLSLASPDIGMDGAIMLASAAAQLTLPASWVRAIRKGRRSLERPRAREGHHA